jgi:undecaprenyl-diphosphatase
VPVPTGGLLPRVRTLVRALAHEEGRLLVALLGLVAAALAFARIADEVAEGDSLPLDARFLVALRNPADPARPIGPAWLLEVATEISALGSWPVLGLLVVAVAGGSLLAGRPRAAAALAATSLGGVGLVAVLKSWFDRTRPDVVAALAVPTGTSFPSGHAALSAIVLLTLGALMARTLQRRSLRVYVLALAVALTGAIGATRVYLGVHWPTDVLAGWAVGLAWALGAWIAVRWRQARTPGP